MTYYTAYNNDWSGDSFKAFPSWKVVDMGNWLIQLEDNKKVYLFNTKNFSGGLFGTPKGLSFSQEFYIADIGGHMNTSPITLDASNGIQIMGQSEVIISSNKHYLCIGNNCIQLN